MHTAGRVLSAGRLGLGAFVLLGGVVLVSARAAPGARPARTGAQIYAQSCAGCHGAKGQGGKGYARPLTGDKSPGQLSAYIGKFMPPGPKKCPPADARLIAAFMHQEFYSPFAQVRNQPARVELSRLTVQQYRSVTADLIGSFRPGAPPAAADQQGLRGEYFRSRRFRPNERVMERVDPELRFDFAKAGPTPEPEKYDPHTFSIRWNGGVLAPETGDYEFILRTDHGVRLWVNDLREPLIDAGVKSGSDTEFRGAIFLLAGRTYPLRVEFSKSTAGVDDTEKLKGKPVSPASISLEWRVPRQAPRLIPQRCLVPNVPAESFVLRTPFPPDDRSMGFERGNSVSREWEEATTEAAIETAGYVSSRLRDLSGVAEDAPDRAARIREFARQFVSRAFRRPLTPELEATYVRGPFDKAPDVDSGLKRALLLCLKSPRFLYQEVSGSSPDAHDTASRLAFALWDSLPDQELLRAAGAGELSTRSQIQAQADRMAGDPRMRAKVRDFFMMWLKVEQTPDLAKDPKRYPGFDEQIAGDLRTSLELTIDNIVWGEKSDYRELLLSDRVYLNGRLAKIYGVNLPPDAPFQAVSLDTGERAGVLTHPYLLACFAYLDGSSPIHRGVLISRNLLGRVLPSPPVAVAPLAADVNPKLTTRQRVELQTRPAACVSCHELINPLGFTLEKFDAIGRLRTQENGQPINASGEYETRDGKLVKFSGVRELAAYLTTSPEAQSAFVEKLFQQLVKQPMRAYGTSATTELQQSFVNSGFNIRRLVVASAVTAALGTGNRQGSR